MSEVSICNQALSLLGAALITSLDDDVQEAKLCKLHYGPARDAVLMERAWTFATTWRTLPKADNPPESMFANAYPIPSDVLLVWFVGIDWNHPETWRVENGYITTDGNSCKAQVILRVEDTSLFSSLFVQALAARLAMELVVPITNSRELLADMSALYRAKLQIAGAKDGQQGTSRRLRSQWLNAVRFRGTTRAGPTV